MAGSTGESGNGMHWSEPTTLTNLLLAVATFALVVVTLIYTGATRKMAGAMYKDYATRNTPLLDVRHHFTSGGRPFRYRATITLINKGAIAIRIEEALIRVGEKELARQGALILGTGESRFIELTIDMGDVTLEREEGRQPDVVAEVRYIGFEGRPKTETFPLPRPWVEQT